MKSIEVIAVGYDGSHESRAALRWSLLLARQTNATVSVVHATGMLEHLDDEFARDSTPGELTELARECDFDESRLTWYVEDGDACSVLLRADAEPLHADLIVVGSRGHGKRAGQMLGSTSLQVAERSTTPVVIVPSSEAAS